MGFASLGIWDLSRPIIELSTWATRSDPNPPPHHTNPETRGKVREAAAARARSMSTTAGYLARRAGQKERVRLLYRRALKDTLNWAVHRHLFYQDASDLRDKFEANRHVENLDVIDRLIDDAEAQQRNFQHPDPYIVPWAPGGTKFTRNPPPPQGIEIIYNYGKEDS